MAHRAQAHPEPLYQQVQTIFASTVLQKTAYPTTPMTMMLRMMMIL